jgi:hypothetical protein
MNGIVCNEQGVVGYRLSLIYTTTFLYKKNWHREPLSKTTKVLYLVFFLKNQILEPSWFFENEKIKCLELTFIENIKEPPNTISHIYK